MTKLTMVGKTLHLEAENETDASHVHAALSHGQWVRMAKGTIQIADVGPEPQLTDHERLINGSCAPCFPVPDDKEVRPVQRAKGNEGDLESCYVQHIGAGCRDRTYEQLYKRMVSVGFILLRSAKGTDNKHWEIWYLPGLWALTGELKGEKDRKKLVRWLFDYVTPGTCAFSGESWALSFD